VLSLSEQQENKKDEAVPAVRILEVFKVAPGRGGVDVPIGTTFPFQTAFARNNSGFRNKGGRFLSFSEN
jgi:hypothetical protein